MPIKNDFISNYTLNQYISIYFKACQGYFTLLYFTFIYKFSTNVKYTFVAKVILWCKLHVIRSK